MAILMWEEKSINYTLQICVPDSLNHPLVLENQKSDSIVHPIGASHKVPQEARNGNPTAHHPLVEFEQLFFLTLSGFQQEF